MSNDATASTASATTMESLLLLDVSDDKYAIETEGGKPGLIPGTNEAKNIWNRFIQEYDIFSRFWAPRYTVAKKCMRYRRRNIFEKSQRDEYMLFDKIPVEPQEMKQVIDVISGQISQTVRGGAIEFEDTNPPPNVARPDVVNVVIKALESRLKLERKKKSALREALYGGIPNWIWFDRERTAEGAPGNLRATLLPWDSTLCSFMFLEEDGSDIDHLKMIGHRTKQEMFEAFPDRKKTFEEHLNMLNTTPDYLNSILGFDQSINSEDRSNILYDRITTGRYDAIQGFLYVISSVFVINKKQEIHINSKSGDVVVLPPEWAKVRRDAWLKMYPDYDLTRKQDYKVLWQTVIDNAGFVWDNSEHWYQDHGDLPGRCYLPALEDKIPTGIGEDMLPYVLSIATSATEGLSQVRTGTGDVTHIVEGSVLNKDDIGKELSAEHGVILHKQSVAEKFGQDVNRLFKREIRTPNDSYLKFEDRMRNQLREIRSVNPAMDLRTDPKKNAKQRMNDLSSIMSINSQFIENYTDFNLSLMQLMCRMLPYCMNEYQIIAINDEFGKTIGPVEVNKPQFSQGPGGAPPMPGQAPAGGPMPGAAPEGGEPEGQGGMTPAMVVVNDLTSARYRVIPTPADDSPTNREREMQEFKDMIAAVGNTLLQIDPDIIAAIWKDWPNRYCREAAEGLSQLAQKKQAAGQQKQQQEHELELAKTQGAQQTEIEKVKRPKWAIHIRPQDIQDAPEGFKMMMETLGQINASAPQGSPQAAQGPEQPAAGPQPGAPAPQQQPKPPQAG